MRPYLLVSGDFHLGGGMDRANYALADYLAHAGHETHLIAHSVDSELAERPNIFFHPVIKPFGSDMLGEPFLDRIGRHWAACIRARGGRVIVNGGNCNWNDVNWVHYVHAVYRPSVTGVLTKRLKARLHDLRSLWRESRVIRRARLVIVNSKRTKTDLTNTLGIPESNINNVYYGVDSSSFRPATPDERSRARTELCWPQREPVILFIGALGDRRKGFDTVFKAWQRLCSDLAWNVKLMVVGTGAMVPEWIKRVELSGMSSHIEFLGKRSDVPRLFAASDALIAPTRYEAYGLAVHEALCCGLPAFVTRTAGVAEQYPPSLEQLLIKDPDDDLDLAERLRSWRLGPEPYRAQMTTLAARLRQHTWNEMAAEIIGLIENRT